MIKLFEEYNQYYTEISMEEYEHITHDNDPKIDELHDDEIVKIKSLVSNFTTRYVGTNATNGKRNELLITFFTKIGTRGLRTGALNWIKVYKYEDEWFYVALLDIKEFLRTKKTENKYYEKIYTDLFTTYYKCDQLEGLLHFIEEKKKEVREEDVKVKNI